MPATKTTECRACVNGFLYQNELGAKSCVSRCPYNYTRFALSGVGGKYGVRTFKERGSLATSSCSGITYFLRRTDCHSTCDECAGGT